MQASAALLPPPETNDTNDNADQPENHIDKVDPHSILHSLNVTVPFRILVDVHRSEQPKHSDPEDEENDIPREENSGGEGADDYWKNGIDQSCHRAENAYRCRKTLRRMGSV